MRDAVQDQIAQAADEFENSMGGALELKADHTENLAVEYNVTSAKIAELAQKYLPLKVAGAADKNGYALVHTARMEVKGLRTDVEKTRKRLNADSQEYIRTVNAEAKRITGLLAPIEEYLEAEEKAVDAEIEAKKAEEQRIVNERNQGRLNALLAVGAPVDLAQVVLMNDTTFTSYLEMATKTHAEAQRVAAEEAAAIKAKEEAEAADKARIAKEEADAREADRQALAKEREAIEAQRAENAAAAAKLKAEQDQLAQERSAAEKAARDEQIRKDAEAKAEAKRIQDEKDKAAEAERQAKAQAEAKAAEETKAKAIEAARPDAEKLEGFAYFLDGKAPPEMATPAGQAAAREIKGLMIKLSAYTRTAAANLTK